MSTTRGSGPRVVLTMIVKNEAHVIRRCLASVRQYIDAWSIADTGSTDGTQEIIREMLGDIPGELIERPWVDFSTNRNEAIDAGLRFEPDWFMTLDADEVFTVQPGFELNLEHDIHSVMFRMADTTAKWPRRVFFRPHLRYKYVLDEVLEDGKTQDVLPACEVISYPDGARSQDGLIPKYNRDVEVLKRALESEPECPRYWFYLAQRLMGARRWEESLEAYKKRLSLLDGFPEERFQSAFMIAQIREELGDEDADGIADQYREAWLLRPERAEPLYAIAAMYSQRGMHPLAEIYARAAQRLQRPPAGLPVDESVYAWRAADLLAGALAEQGKLTEAAYILERLIPLPQVPDEEKPRLRENLAELRKVQADPVPIIVGDEATYLEQASRIRAHGLKGLRMLSREFLANPGMQSMPSPVRWLWIFLVLINDKWVPLLSGALCLVGAFAFGGWVSVPLVAASPLLVLLSRKVLQDTTVAALTLGALFAAFTGNHWALAVLVFALAAVKEASVLMMPAVAFAWWLSGGSLVEGGLAVLVGGSLAIAVGWSLLRSAWWPVLRAASKAHKTPYTQDNQSGAPHRLIVDLLMVSPVALLLGLFGPWQTLAMVGLILFTHTLSPVRNVRTVLVADLLLRVAAVQAFGWWALFSVPVDLYITKRLRDVYDPVTGALARALGFAR